MKLSEFFTKKDVLRDAEFVLLGYTDNRLSGTLAYCDTASFLESAAQNSAVSAIITLPEYADRIPSDKGLVISKSPRNSFYKLHLRLLDEGRLSVPMNFDIGKDCDIHPTAIISKKSKIGDRVIIGPGVIIKDYVEIGDNCFIDAGAMLGSEGLLYMIDEGNVVFVRHAGGVKIGKNVTLLTNAVIVRSIHETYLTTVGDNSIIAGCTIGHEAQVGKNCVVSGNCLIARRAKIEDGAWIGSGCVIREHIRIGRQAQVKAGSVVIKDVPDHQSVSGNFALDHERNMMNYLKSQKARRSTL